MSVAPLPPKLITLEQRTPEWHAWRRGEDLPDGGPRITASMVPQIIGTSPYGNAYDLWLELTGRKAGKQTNRAMQRGIDLEPIARAAYTAHTGIDVEDVCVEHPTVPWAAASLDGLSLFGDVIVEIKCPGADDHAQAAFGEVPSKYVPQTQWQLFCCPNAKSLHYWSFDGENGVMVEVSRDEVYQDFLYERALHFRQSVIDDSPPDGEEFAALALQIRHLYAEKKSVEERYKSLSADIALLVPEHAKSASFGGVTVSRSSQSEGKIDYEALIKDLNVPVATVEKFRKQPKAGDSYRVTVNLEAVVPELGHSVTGLVVQPETETTQDNLAW